MIVLMSQAKIIQNFFYIDFGHATFYKDPISGKIYEQGNAIGYAGTYQYMSHDAYIRKNLGRRSDLESLGYVLRSFANDSFPFPFSYNIYFPPVSYKMKKDLNYDVSLR